jgi:hypothetical protein
MAYDNEAGRTCIVCVSTAMNLVIDVFQPSNHALLTSANDRASRASRVTASNPNLMAPLPPNQNV